MVKMILKYTSRTASVIFHPILMPIYLFTILMFSSSLMMNNPLSVKLSILKMVGFITLLTPVVSIGVSLLINRLMGERSSNVYNDILISAVLAISYVLAIFVLKDYITLRLSLRLFLAPLLIVVLYHVFRQVRFHFSMWTAACGALVTLLYLLSISHIQGLISLLFWAIVIGGVVGSARMTEKKNTLIEVSIGYFIGFIAAVLSFYLPTL